MMLHPFDVLLASTVEFEGDALSAEQRQGLKQRARGPADGGPVVDLRAAYEKHFDDVFAESAPDRTRMIASLIGAPAP